MEGFRLGECLITPSLNRIDRKGTLVRVEPKVMQLLCCLADSAGEVCSRESLLATVWPGRIVEDETLSSAITKLRRALGDQPQKPRFVETVPKRGYRLIAAVEAQVPAASPAARTDVAPEPASPGIAVLPFADYSADKDMSILAEGLAEDITAALSRIRWLRVISRSSVRHVAADAPAERVAAELGVEFLVRGTVRSTAGRLRVSAALEASGSGEVIWSERYDRPAADVFSVENDVCQRLLSRLEVEIGGALQMRLKTKPPASLTAWEAYHRSLAARVGVTGVELTDAKRHFRQAVELDPAFSAPKAALALALISEVIQFVTPVE